MARLLQGRYRQIIQLYPDVLVDTTWRYWRSHVAMPIIAGLFPVRILQGNPANLISSGKKWGLEAQNSPFCVSKLTHPCCKCIGWAPDPTSMIVTRNCSSRTPLVQRCPHSHAVTTISYYGQPNNKPTIWGRWNPAQVWWFWAFYVGNIFQSFYIFKYIPMILHDDEFTKFLNIQIYSNPPSGWCNGSPKKNTSLPPPGSSIKMSSCFCRSASSASAAQRRASSSTWSIQNSSRGKKIRSLAGWWLGHPLKNMKVNWDDYPNIWENRKWQPNHQPASVQETSDICGHITRVIRCYTGYIPTYGDEHRQLYPEKSPHLHPWVFTFCEVL